MQLGKNHALIIGFLTLLPHLFGLYGLWVFLSFILSLNGEPPESIPASFLTVFVGSGIMAILSLALVAFYLVHLYYEKDTDSEKKWLWAAAIVFVAHLSMPFYWWYRIWKPATMSQVETPPPFIPEPPEEPRERRRVYDL